MDSKIRSQANTILLFAVMLIWAYFSIFGRSVLLFVNTIFTAFYLTAAIGSLYYYYQLKLGQVQKLTYETSRLEYLLGLIYLMEYIYLTIFLCNINKTEGAIASGLSIIFGLLIVFIAKISK